MNPPKLYTVFNLEPPPPTPSLQSSQFSAPSIILSSDLDWWFVSLIHVSSTILPRSPSHSPRDFQMSLWLWELFCHFSWYYWSWEALSPVWMGAGKSAGWDGFSWLQRLRQPFFTWALILPQEWFENYFDQASNIFVVLKFAQSVNSLWPIVAARPGFPVIPIHRLSSISWSW